MTVSLERSGSFTGTALLPMMGRTNRRLILAPSSAARIAMPVSGRWKNGHPMRQAYWNAHAFAELVDATVTPNSVMIADLANKRGNHWTDVGLRLSYDESDFAEMLKVLRGKVGRLRIHHGYNLRTRAMSSVDFNCGGSSSSTIHLITGGVWADLSGLYRSQPSGSIDRAWTRVLGSLAGLCEPINLEHSFFDRLVRPGFRCPFDSIVEVIDSHHCFSSGLPASLQAYHTLRVAG